MIQTSCRSLITGLISFAVAAPAIVRASSLMPVKVVHPWISFNELSAMGEGILEYLRRECPYVYDVPDWPTGICIIKCEAA